MKAISLWQPWASLWLTDCKLNETRHWATSYRGWLAVHAAKRFQRGVDGDLEDILISEFGGHWGMDLPTGAIIGAVDLQSCLVMPKAVPANDDDRVCGNWENGRFAWRRGSAVKLTVPIPYRGAQGLFNIPDEIVATILPSQAKAQGSIL